MSARRATFKKTVGAVLILALARQQAAWSQSANAREAEAEALFREGKRLLEARDYAQACPKLAESYRLDPATGALLALAICREGAGNLASAWSAYAEVAERSKAEGRADREKAAREKAAALEAKLSMLTIVVARAADVVGLRVQRDGEETARAAWGVAVPVDAGAHTIVATAPGRSPWRATITIGVKAERRRIEVPVLVTAASEVSGARDRTPAPASSIESPRDPATAVRGAPGSDRTAPGRDGLNLRQAASLGARPETRRGFTQTETAGLVIAGAGALALAGAGAFAIYALGKKDSYESQGDACQWDCPDLRAANTAGDRATGFAIGGLALAAIGITTFVLGRRRANRAASAPNVALHASGVTAVGAWRFGSAGVRWIF